ncbi:MAG: hypothetical protein ACE37D_01445 [Pseudomonadales bacterium]
MFRPIPLKLYATLLLISSTLFYAGCLAAEKPDRPSDVAPEAAPQPSPLEPERQIVVITEPEFVPISQYFDAVFDPNLTEPSAAGVPTPRKKHLTHHP